MSHNSDAKQGRFFEAKLTQRHLLTRRHGAVALTLVGLFAVAIAISTGRSLFHAATNSPVHGLPSARPLLVATREISHAGPSFLTQEFTGIVSARRTTQLAAKALGRVEQLDVDLGDKVLAGQMLVRLDREQLQAQRDIIAANMAAAAALLSELHNGPRRQDIEQSEARVRELRSLTELQQSNFSRTENLRDSAAISAQELDENSFRTQAIEAQLSSAEKSLELLREGTREEQLAAQRAVLDGLAAQLKALDIQLEEKQIVAPYDGHVQARWVDEGAIVSPGQPLLEIVETGRLEVHLGVPPDLAENLIEGAILVSQEGIEFPATMARLAPAIQLATRTRELVLELGQSESRQVAVGAAVNVRLKTRVAAQGYWIPTAALTAGERGLWAVFVAVPKPNSATDETAATHVIERRPVEMLRSQGTWAEIRGPVSATDQIVIEGVHRLVAGQSVSRSDDDDSRVGRSEGFLSN